MNGQLRRDITPSRLREVLRYEPTTGLFFWTVKPRGRSAADGTAGTVIKRGPSAGRRRICVDGCIYLASRLAWLYMTGEWPRGDVDHMDGDRSNDRWTNLRDISHAENMQNRRAPSKSNKVGLLGVSPKREGKYVASLSIDRKQFYLGAFDTPEDAFRAYTDAKRTLHPACTI